MYTFVSSCWVQSRCPGDHGRKSQSSRGVTRSCPAVAGLHRPPCCDTTAYHSINNDLIFKATQLDTGYTHNSSEAEVQMSTATTVVAEAPGQLYNWNLTEASSPSVIAQARTVEDVERVLKNDADFPSPVRCTAITLIRQLAVIIHHMSYSSALAVGNDAAQQHVAPAASPAGGQCFALQACLPLLPCTKLTQFLLFAPLQVLAVGAMHSVNACMTNNGGTVLNMSSMNAVLGLEPHGVRLQAGCKMADIYDWLATHVSGQPAAPLGWLLSSTCACRP
jgi:hypothetical protein